MKKPVTILLLLTWFAVTAGPLFAQKFNTDALLNDLLFSGINENKFVGHLQLQATTRASQIATICELDEAQARKLSEAVEGDVARLRHSIVALRQQARDLPAHLEIMQQQREVQELAAQFKQSNSAERWLDSSLFTRTFNRIATPEQKDKLRRYVADRESQYERAVVMQTIVTIEQTMLMTEKQRTWLFDQLMSIEVVGNSRSTMHAVGFQKLAMLKPEILKEVFSADEIDKLTVIQSVVARPKP